MSTRQAERSEATRRQLLGVARQRFARDGYAGVSLEELAEGAGVTKGALYHHFRNKQDLFRAVFEELQVELMQKVVLAADAAHDAGIWEGIRAGVRAFLEGALDPAVQMIVLIDGPSVLGWDTWREIDERHAFQITKGALEVAMETGIIERRPAEPLTHLFLASLSEAALRIARADDTDRAMEEMSSALFALLDNMRIDRA